MTEKQAYREQTLQEVVDALPCPHRAQIELIALNHKIKELEGTEKAYIVKVNLLIEKLEEAEKEIVELKIDKRKNAELWLESETRIGVVIENAAKLCERVRCREWKPKECAWQIRDHYERGMLEKTK